MSSTEMRDRGAGPRTDVRELRRFGLMVGGIFAAIGLWPLVVRAASPRGWAVGLGLALVALAVVAPRVLGPVHRLWMALAEVLGRLNTWILLTIVFFGLVTPMGVVMRFLGKDPMRRRFDRAASTYRVGRQSRQPTHMMRQF